MLRIVIYRGKRSNDVFWDVFVQEFSPVAKVIIRDFPIYKTPKIAIYKNDEMIEWIQSDYYYKTRATINLKHHTTCCVIL